MADQHLRTCGHDRAWAEYPVYWKIRYISREGCRRTFAVPAHIAGVKEGTPIPRPAEEKTMNIVRTVKLVFWALMLLPGCAAREPYPPLPTVDYVDLQRYAGRWYEIARYPHSFEQGCTAVTADYSLREDGTLRVINQCLRADKGGKPDTAAGRARVVDPGTNARLKVTFFWPFYGDYWILRLDPDYRYAVVGAPSRKYLWILARSPQLEPALLRELMEEAGRLGFDPGLLIMTDQSVNIPPN